MAEIMRLVLETNSTYSPRVSLSLCLARQPLTQCLEWSPSLSSAKKFKFEFNGPHLGTSLRKLTVRKTYCENEPNILMMKRAALLYSATYLKGAFSCGDIWLPNLDFQSHRCFYYFPHGNGPECMLNTVRQ